jgi:hypothetical protein
MISKTTVVVNLLKPDSCGDDIKYFIYRLSARRQYFSPCVLAERPGCPISKKDYAEVFMGATSLNPLPWMFTISMLLSSRRYFLSLAMYTSILRPLK